MWTSTLPTGTVRTEGLADRTVPADTQTGHTQHPDSRDSTGKRDQQRSESPTTTELTRLQARHAAAQAEIERLESQVGLLRRQLAKRQAAEQAIIDRYEQLISELQQAAATRPSNRRPKQAKNLTVSAKISRWLQG